MPPAESAPDVEPAVEPAAVPQPVREPGGEQAEGGRGKHARAGTSYGESASLDGDDRAALEARADEMLAILAAESTHPMGPLAARLESTASRVVAGLVGLVGLSLAGLLVMTVLGHFL